MYHWFIDMCRTYVYFGDYKMWSRRSDRAIFVWKVPLNSNQPMINQQEAFEKCWTHSPLRVVLHCHSPGVATVVRLLRIDVLDNDDNAWQRGPLWPHRMGPTSQIVLELNCVTTMPLRRISTHLENLENFCKFVRPGIFGIISRFTLFLTL